MNNLKDGDLMGVDSDLCNAQKNGASSYACKSSDIRTSKNACTSSDIQKAKGLLAENTCVLVKDNIVHISKYTGIRPMMDFIARGVDLKGFSAADKVVGRAAAMLFALSGVTEIYAEVLSKAAANVLAKHNIKYTYGTLAEVIKNRANTGVCPMEQAVEHIDFPEAAHQALRQKLDELSKQIKTN